MEVRLHRELSCPPDRVWQALTSPDALAAWFWPENFGTSVRAELRVGGRYQIAAPAAELAVAGRYLAVERPDRLAFTWQWDGEAANTQVSILLRPAGAGTELTLSHGQFADEASRDDHVKGWSDCLDRLPGWLSADGAAC